MKLNATREVLLKPLQAVIGVVERRQTMPILGNLLLVARDGQLAITATDLEVELVASAELDVNVAGEVTAPARKLLDICRALPDQAAVSISLKGDKLTIRSGRSRFNLATLPAADFPTLENIDAGQSLQIPQGALHRLFDKTYFAMAQQDVRYYLNGLLIETAKGHLRAVATDGHRLALSQVEVDGAGLAGQQVIVPRKGVLELQRLLKDEGELKLELGSNHIRIHLDNIRFTSKLIDGRFPEYERVIPKDPANVLIADRKGLRDAFQRAAILSNEKYRGIRLNVKDSGVVIQAHNPEQEEAEEELEVEYTGEDLEIGFNVNYLMDALAAIETEQVSLGFVDGSSSCLIREPDKDDCKYVVMPMRL